MMPTIRRGLALAAVFALAAPAATGQGLVIDRRPDRPIAGGFDVEQVVVDAAVRDQVAQVRVSQTLANPARAARSRPSTSSRSPRPARSRTSSSSSTARSWPAS